MLDQTDLARLRPNQAPDRVRPPYNALRFHTHEEGQLALVAERAFDGVIASPLAGRAPKPRRQGQTMVIDKGLGLTQTRDLLELAADYIDYIRS
jgi:hypothetical protein